MDFVWQWLLEHVNNKTLDSILVIGLGLLLTFNVIRKIYNFFKNFGPAIKEHIANIRQLSKLHEFAPKLDQIIKNQEHINSALPGLQKTVNLILQIQNIARYDCTPDGNCISVNAVWSNWTGINEEDALGQGWVVAIHEEDRSRVCKEWDEAITHKRPFVSKFRYKHIHTGQITHVISNSYNIVDENNKDLYIIGIAKIVGTQDVNC